MQMNKRAIVSTKLPLLLYGFKQTIGIRINFAVCVYELQTKEAKIQARLIDAHTCPIAHVAVHSSKTKNVCMFVCQCLHVLIYSPLLCLLVAPTR